MVNSTPIYTQSFTGEESFIQYQTLNDLVKNTSPFIYTTYENAAKVSPNVCGTYVKWNELNSTTSVSSWSNIKIPIQIPISNFLILKNLKYLMSWMGKREIRLYFSAQNLIYLPIEYSVASTACDLSYSTTSGETTTKYTIASAISGGDAALSHNFTQIGMACSWYAWDSSESTVVAGSENTLYATKMTLNNVEMNTAQFQIRMDIMEMLKQKYMSEKPLTFPVSTIQISRFTGTPASSTSTSNVALSIVLCQAINNCDTLFVLPFRNALQHTVCTNPYVFDL